MTDATDDEHGNDGLHPDNVEDDEELDKINIYTATRETLDVRIGYHEDAEEPVSKT